jgi:hypothetical protein
MTGARRGTRSLAAVACLAAQLGATGCATLRELPRAEYAARPERKGVVVDTREGLHYRFDLARFGPDTLTGHRLRDTEGPFEEYATVAIPLESVERLKVRRTSWWRTGLIAGGIVLAVVTAAVARSQGTTPTDPGPIEPPPVDP